jgi:RNA polymerase sigma factor (TIGR02999 family)
MSNSPGDSAEVTRLLVDWGNGDQAALELLMPLVYRELRRLAHHYVNKEHPGHALQTTELVHEAYLKLIDQKSVQWQNRAHFFGIAAQLMRRILVDNARHRNRAKRGGGARFVSLAQARAASESVVDVLALDEALTRLAEFDQRKARIVELRFFGGLEVEEAASFLNVSEVTVARDWRMAKAWLHKELSPSDS